MNIKSILIFSGLVFLSGLEACIIKDELTEPTPVSFEFTMNIEPEDGKFLHFDEGELILEALEFEGNREAGDDIFFVSTFETSLEADLDLGQANQEVTYDIPQGIYQRIKLRLGDEEMTSGPAITYTGTYSSVRNGDIPVIIDFSDIDPIEMIAEDRNSQNEIVLNKEIPTQAEIHFDPFFLFQISNSRQLESADISTIDGEQVIIISKDSNSVIFNIIINRLERSISAIFN